MGKGWSTSDVAKVYAKQGLAMPEAVKQACGDGGQRRSKYNVGQDAESLAKRTVDDILFDSQKEAQAYISLKIARDNGLIADLELQPLFLLQAAFRDDKGKKHRKIEYRADFRFLRCLPGHMPDESVVVDVKSKGTMTQLFRVKWKMALSKYPQYKWEIWD
jgi:hypothetical protein